MKKLTVLTTSLAFLFAGALGYSEDISLSDAANPFLISEGSTYEAPRKPEYPADPDNTAEMEAYWAAVMEYERLVEERKGKCLVEASKKAHEIYNGYVNQTNVFPYPTDGSEIMFSIGWEGDSPTAVGACTYEIEVGWTLMPPPPPLPEEPMMEEPADMGMTEPMEEPMVEEPADMGMTEPMEEPVVEEPADMGMTDPMMP